MPTINYISVMNQLAGASPHVSCGVHTFKNTFLTLMRDKNIITQEEYNNLLKSKPLFEDLHQMFVNKQLPTGDITPEDFLNFTQMAMNQELDLTKYGIKPEYFNQLNLQQDGNQKYIAFAYQAYQNESNYPFGLMNAATIVKFARSTGKETCVVAVGSRKFGDIGHWITIAAKKGKDGSYTWDLMDSWNNDRAFGNGLINRLDAVLNSSELELQQYLRDSYVDANIAVIINNRFRDYFNVDTLQPEQYSVVEAKAFMITNSVNRKQYTAHVDELYNFIKLAGWLENPGPEEMLHIKKLHAVAKFMYDNAAPEHHLLKDTFKPLIDDLEKAIAAPGLDIEPHEDEVVIDSIDDNPAQNIDAIVPHENDEAVGKDNLAQNIEAIAAVEHGKPLVTTPSFINRLVNSIANLLKGIKSAITSLVDYVVKAIGVNG